MIKGTAASRVNSPATNRAPHTTSTLPTNGPIISGAGIPIFTNRPAPSSSGYRNFWMPSVRNTSPTIDRTSTTAAGARVSNILLILIGVCFFTAHCTERCAGEGELPFGCAHHASSLTEGAWKVNGGFFGILGCCGRVVAGGGKTRGRVVGAVWQHNRRGAQTRLRFQASASSIVHVVPKSWLYYE
jgi:hypothetical protein